MRQVRRLQLMAYLQDRTSNSISHGTSDGLNNDSTQLLPTCLLSLLGKQVSDPALLRVLRSVMR